MTAMNPQALPLPALGASQAIGVEEIDEFGVAGVLIEIGDQGEIHGRDLRETSRIPREEITIRTDRQEAEHRVGLMSQSMISKKIDESGLDIQSPSFLNLRFAR